jgi:hypothetical protein
MPVIVRVATNQFRDMIGRFARATNAAAVEHSRSHVETAARTLKEALRAEAPVGKPDPLGRPRKEPPLAQNIGYNLRRGGRGWQIEFNAPPHARFVIGGTRPHPIYGKKCPLHFYWERIGRAVWFWSVNHPGTLPNRFDVRAARRVKAEVDRELGRGTLVFLNKVMGKG